MLNIADFIIINYENCNYVSIVSIPISSTTNSLCEEMFVIITSLSITSFRFTVLSSATPSVTTIILTSKLIPF